MFIKKSNNFAEKKEMEHLLQFTVGNFRSIKTPITFTLKPYTKVKDNPKSAVVSQNKTKFLTASSIYGANSSGKTNLIIAMGVMKSFVRNSVRLNDGDELPNYEPFLLSEESISKPTLMEVCFLNEKDEHVKYGFEFNRYLIEKEWLFINDQVLFAREPNGIYIDTDTFGEGVDYEKRTNNNRLFLSLVAQVGGPISNQILKFFIYNMNVIKGTSSEGYEEFTKIMFHEHLDEEKKALDFFKRIKLGFNNITTEVRELSIPDYVVPVLNEQIRKDLEKRKQIVVHPWHNIYDNQGLVVREIPFDINEHESEGTRKAFEIAGPIFNTLKRGSVLAIDELDAKMHPLISVEIIKLFTSKETNPNHAQLIFTTHDTNLLSAKLLRRDMIWFTEKNQIEETDLYRFTQIRLPDGTMPRGDGNIEHNYINGRYGAIPFISPF